MERIVICFVFFKPIQQQALFSGKSTILKQMKILHLKGFTQEELNFYRKILHRNTIEALGTIIA
jgi:hypothetical protein